MAIYDEIPFLRNVVMTEVVRNMRLEDDLIGGRLIPDNEIFSRETEWEVVYGARTLAPLVAQDVPTPLVGAPRVERIKTNAVDSRVKYLLTENDVLFLRMPGKREQRIGREQIEQHLTRLRNMVLARKEKNIWDIFLSGSTTYLETVDGNVVSKKLDYRIPQTQFVSSSANWGSSPGTADPRKDFVSGSNIVREATGRRVKTAWMNTNTHQTLDVVSGLRTDWRNQESAPQDLVKNEHVTDIVANIRIRDYDEGHFGTSLVDANLSGKDSGGTFEYYLPNNRIVFMVTETGSDRGEKFADYAIAPAMLSDESTATGLFAERFTTFDPPNTYLRVGIVGIPRVMHGDWFVTMNTAA